MEFLSQVCIHDPFHHISDLQILLHLAGTALSRTAVHDLLHIHVLRRYYRPDTTAIPVHRIFLPYHLCTKNSSTLRIFPVRRLPDMSRPFTVCNFHIGKYGFKRRILCTAGIDTKRNRFSGMKHMADTHLMIIHTIRRIFNTKIIVSAA